MCWWMMLCKIIRQIRFTGPPINFELPLLRPIQQPLEPHIHRFGSFRSDPRIYYSLRRGVVGLNGRARLSMPHLLQDTPQIYRFFGINSIVITELMSCFSSVAEKNL
jgi:hypothetical protein